MIERGDIKRELGLRIIAKTRPGRMDARIAAMLHEARGDCLTLAIGLAQIDGHAAGCKRVLIARGGAPGSDSELCGHAAEMMETVCELARRLSMQVELLDRCLLRHGREPAETEEPENAAGP